MTNTPKASNRAGDSVGDEYSDGNEILMRSNLQVVGSEVNAELSLELTSVSPKNGLDSRPTRSEIS